MLTLKSANDMWIVVVQDVEAMLRSVTTLDIETVRLGVLDFLGAALGGGHAEPPVQLLVVDSISIAESTSRVAGIDVDESLIDL